MKKMLVNLIKWFCTALNAVVGYCLPMYCVLLFLFLTNHPKGFSYYIPDDEYIISLTFAILMFFILITAELLINIPMFKLQTYSSKIKFLMVFVFTVCGASVYFVINGMEPIMRAIR